MGVTISRWCLGVALICVVVTSIAVPFPEVEPRRWVTASPAPLANELSRLVGASGDAYAAVRRYRSMQGLERWRIASARGNTTLVRLDASVPAALQAAVRTAAVDQWATLAPRPSAAGAEVFIYVDSSTIPRATAVDTKRRALEPRRLVDVSFAMPAVGRDRCVTLVRLRGTSAAHVDALRNQALVGPCRFYASFGLPGNGVRAWLASARYRFVRRGDWAMPRAPAIDPSALYTLSEQGTRCLTGTRSACSTALGLGSASSMPEPSAWDPVTGEFDSSQPSSTRADAPDTRSLGEDEGALLADAVRDIGSERFARFWRSDLEPDVAFAAATGETLGTWTQRWLDRSYGPVPDSPAALAFNVVWLAVSSAIGLVVAARPRQSVLSERLGGVGT